MNEVHAMLHKVYGISVESGLPSCETCGVTLEVYSDIAVDYEPSYNASRIFGACPKCHTTYEWKDYYVYTGFGNLKKMY